MEIYWQVMMFVFGAVIGSFLNVVIYRLHTGKSLSGRSHCMSCGKSLSWYELFPIFSYISQRGKCRGCSAYIPSRYLMVELLTGALFLLVFSIFTNEAVLLALHLILVSLLVVILVYDLRHTIIPDELTIMVGGVSVLMLIYKFLNASERSLEVVGESILAGICAGGFFYSLWYVSKGRWIGLGDAKLALPLGIIVGLSGVFSMVVLSFWIGAVVSVTLLFLERIMKRGKKALHFLPTPLTIKSEVPFAPFMIAGFLLVQFFHADIFEITYRVFFS